MTQISEDFIKSIALKKFGLDASVTALPGDEDSNFLLTSSADESFILKVAEPKNSLGFLKFQNEILNHLQTNAADLILPIAQIDSSNESISEIEVDGNKRLVRMLSWVPGRLWAKVNPKTQTLREDLGKRAGELTSMLRDFEHTQAHRDFDWNLANARWTEKHLSLFSEEKKDLIVNFQRRFTEIETSYLELPKSIIHGDLNDYNILVSEDFMAPHVQGFIDFGDAVYTQTINDLAILLAYACMNVSDPLAAACDVVKGYHKSHPLTEKELECLYPLVAMRLVVTVTKAALRTRENTGNTYHNVSEEPAWDLLEKWARVQGQFAYYSFRNACGFTAHPLKTKFHDWAKDHQVSLDTMFPSQNIKTVSVLDMSVGSTLLGNLNEYSDPEVATFKLQQFNRQYPQTLLANGYLETRPFYTTNTFKTEGNSGPQYRTVHLGTDFWLPAQTPVHAPFKGTVKILHHNDFDKDYGPMLILEHKTEDFTFYTLYGHLTMTSLTHVKVGQKVEQGECIAYVGAANENGNWAPHIHFQVILDLLGNDHNFNGVALPSEIDVWKSICPDPNLLFSEDLSLQEEASSEEEMIAYRKEHLGKSLSLSYSKPMHIVRGEGVFLIDTDGRKYLDTANNVNHVGHQHPKVVAAGQRQMAVLNTNTRYLHEEIINYTKALLQKLPKELSVLHVVNSGSEANELALRMAKTVTGNNDFLAIEAGYHGNTNAVSDVSSYKFDGKGGQGKPKTTHILPLPDPYRGIHTGVNCGSEYAAYAQRFVKALKVEGKGIAGFIGESMISCGGQIVPPTNYFKDIYKTVRKAGGICIADEVQTGFGRMGKSFWAFELYGVVPDIMTMGKPAGNGHPLAIVACTQEVAEKFDTGMEFFNTFGGNPVSSAIGRTVLEVIEEENLQQNALEVGGFLKEELQKLQSQFPIIGDVRGEGLFLGFELNNSKKEPLAKQAKYLADRMKDLGILMSTDGPDYNVLKIKPPMVFSRENALELVKRLQTVLSEDFMQYYEN